MKPSPNSPSLFDPVAVTQHPPDWRMERIAALERRVAELEAENSRLKVENARLLSNPGHERPGKFTTGRSGSKTSLKAALLNMPAFATKRREVLSLLASVHPDGLTDEQIQMRTGWDIRCCNARRKELEEDGWVILAEEHRIAKSGREVAVWKLSPTGAAKLNKD